MKKKKKKNKITIYNQSGPHKNYVTLYYSTAPGTCTGRHLQKRITLGIAGVRYLTG